MVAAFPELYLESRSNALITLKDLNAIVTLLFAGRFLANKCRASARANSEFALNLLDDAITSISNLSPKNAAALLRLNGLLLWLFFFELMLQYDFPVSI